MRYVYTNSTAAAIIQKYMWIERKNIEVWEKIWIG